MAFKNLEDQRAYNRAYYAENTDKIAENNHRWYESHKEEIADKQRVKLADPIEREKHNERNRLSRHARREEYNLGVRCRNKRITKQDYHEMLESQGGVCACCLKPFEEGSKPYIDHDHDTEEVRGLIHVGCNSGLGLLGDDIEGLQRALNYLISVACRSDIRKVA
jgi:hypothetical protein